MSFLQGPLFCSTYTALLLEEILTRKYACAPLRVFLHNWHRSMREEWMLLSRVEFDASEF